MRISHRDHLNSPMPSIEYIDRPVIQYVDRDVERIVEIERPIIQYVDRTVEIPAKIDLAPLYSLHNELASKIVEHQELHKKVYTELEMQRRVLVALKDQRTVDRQRRLQFIRRIKKEHAAHKKTEFLLKLAVTASILLSTIISLVMR